jgi:cytochrome c-type biogenesis protein
MDNISPLIAFTGGIISLLSPCILPMVPVYLASLCGPEILNRDVPLPRLSIFLHSLTFILGFSLVFVLLGAGAGSIGDVINSHIRLVRWISGSLMILFGLVMLASQRISRLNVEKRLSYQKSFTGSHLRSFIIGILFALAWTPCVGPVLAGILSLAFNSGSAGQGAILLGLYSLGLGLPFLIIGLALGSILPLIKRLNRFSVFIYIAGGLFLIIIGILIIINRLSWFS